jgi:glycosyltransferase 2 family protein
VNKKRLLYVVLGAVLCIGLILFLQNRFGNINYYYLIAGFFVYTLVLFLRSFKLNRILNVYTNIGFKETLSLTASSQLMGAFIPGRAGEILVSAYLKFKYIIDVSKVLPILFLDKIIELLCVLLYSLIAISIFSGNLFSFVSDNFKGIQDNYLILIVVIFCIILFFIMVIKIFGARLRSILVNIKQSLLIPIKEPKLGVIIIITSFLTIISEYFYLYLIFHAFNIEITIAKIIIVHSLGMIVGVLSMIPGGQGSTEVTMIAILHFWGYTTLAVLSPILASKILTYVTLFIYAVPLLPYSISVLKQKKISRKKVDSE